MPASNETENQRSYAKTRLLSDGRHELRNLPAQVPFILDACDSSNLKHCSAYEMQRMKHCELFRVTERIVAAATSTRANGFPQLDHETIINLSFQ